MIEVLLLAAFLNRPQALVQQVCAAGGIDAVAIVSCENPRWIPDLVVREGHGLTSYGLGMICDGWHKQYRGDLEKHIAEFVRIYREECPGATMAEKISHYNGGTYPGPYSIAWGKRVQAKRDELVRWLRWREIQALETICR